MPRRLVCTSCRHLWPVDLLALRDGEACPICAGHLVDEDHVVREPAGDDEQSAR